MRFIFFYSLLSVSACCPLKNGLKCKEYRLEGNDFSIYLTFSLICKISHFISDKTYKISHFLAVRKRRGSPYGFFLADYSATATGYFDALALAVRKGICTGEISCLSLLTEFKRLFQPIYEYTTLPFRRRISRFRCSLRSESRRDAHHTPL